MGAILREAEYLGENPSALPKSFDVEGITNGLIRRRLYLETNESLCLNLYLNGCSSCENCMRRVKQRRQTIEILCNACERYHLSRVGEN